MRSSNVTESHLQQARRHVAEAEKRVAAQRQLIAKMMRDGDGAATIDAGKGLLRTLEQALKTMRAHLAMEEKSARER
jgi:ribosomal 50S subunit-associated protein YjgA (DUF615 family)